MRLIFLARSCVLVLAATGEQLSCSAGRENKMKAAFFSDACTTSEVINMLQRSVSLPASRAVPRPEDLLQAIQDEGVDARQVLHSSLDDDTVLRMEDAKLRETNSHLKMQLEQKVFALSQRASKLLVRKQFVDNLTEPLTLTMIAAVVAVVVYGLTYLSHLLMQHVANYQIRRRNASKVVGAKLGKPPDLAKLEEQMQTNFICGLRQITVIRVLVIFVGAVGSGAWLGKHGYLHSISTKIVPQLYLWAIGFMLLHVLLWQACAFAEPVFKLLGKFKAFVRDLESGITLAWHTEGEGNRYA
eukprot:TRINITY_DN103205_c0_g1_i1.p1 TRINITY_DN103205_c0_g1~~TRINITY_DN103205_c0_g1_i1.p1  ORF type:complete len:300 (-),score=51.45 TRINITY_DN103205_c0_g1_i1:58-957(-)